MTKLDLIRAAIHFPVGVFTAFLLLIHPTTGIAFTISFLAYEFINDWRKHDNSYKDIYGFLWGFAVGVVFLYFATKG